VQNVKYGPHERNVLDLWLAKTAKPAPLLVYIHGGGFYVGDKSSVDPNMLRTCMGLGITVAAINYRYSSQAPYPAPMLDSARAIQFLRCHAAEYKIDPQRVAATGGSAGAGISLWIGFHPDLADTAAGDPVARQSTRLACMIVGGAQTSYDPRYIKEHIGAPAARHPAILKLYGLKPEEADTPRAHKMYEEAAPINYVDKDSPPVLMYYGESKDPVPADAPPGAGIHHVKFGWLLKEKMDRLGIECIVHHRDDDAGLPPGERFDYLRDFLSRHLAPERPASGRKDARPTFNRARFFPAPGREQAMLGGRFSGSNVSARAGFEPLAQIRSVPAAGQWTELSFANPKLYRWIRYEAPPGSHGNVAELEFDFGQRQPWGRPFGSFGWRAMRNWPRAVDHKTDTWFDSDCPDGQYVGLDVGELGTAQFPRMDPPPGEAKGPLRVALRCNTPGAIVRYSFQECPGPGDGQLYKGPIVVDRTTTIFAVAFHEGMPPSPLACGTYFFGARPGLSTLHIGNSLTQSTVGFPRFARAAGYLHQYQLSTHGGGNTRVVWNDPALRKEWEQILAAAARLDHFTVQPRFAHFQQADFDDELKYDLLFFELVRAKFPQVQPWIYAEWPGRREGDRSSGWTPIFDSRMHPLGPTLSYEESSAALLFYIEELQRKMLETDRGPHRPRILPCALAAGWLKNWLDHGKIPGLSASDFDLVMFSDNVHPDDPGRYLMDLVWFAAFYRQSPLGKVPPVGIELKAVQAEALQRLAWDIVRNYPDCGLYEEGATPCGEPQFASAPAAIKDLARVTLSSATPGAWFRYTLDGTRPTRTRGYVYCGVIHVPPGMTLQAVAYKSGMADSRVATAPRPCAGFGPAKAATLP
jgi:acetyl esterase/lipase